MFLAVWLIYSCDRLLDSRNPHHPASAHFFHQSHRRAFTIAAILAALGIVALLPAIPLPLLGPYLILATFLFAWLLLIHFTTLSLPIPKTCAPGLFFAAAVFIPALPQYSAAALLFPALCFAALCTLNCLLIQFWERHPTPAPATRLQALALALVIVPFLLPSPVSHAISLAASVLLALCHHRTRLLPTTLRAAADLALLTPLLLLPSLK